QQPGKPKPPGNPPAPPERDPAKPPPIDEPPEPVPPPLDVPPTPMESEAGDWPSRRQRAGGIGRGLRSASIAT
ncbi:MAG: hypothetical protein KGI43_11240, partial [Alphaproteobacteria bacterium]|nr:hypothetical protein [Alphaproteobacteria bacterium]